MENCSSYQCQLNTLGVVGTAVGWASRWFTAILMTFQSFGCISCLICFIHLFCGLHRHEQFGRQKLMFRIKSRLTFVYFCCPFLKAVLGILDVLPLFGPWRMILLVYNCTFSWCRKFPVNCSVLSTPKWFSLISSISSYSEAQNSCCPLLFSWFR